MKYDGTQNVPDALTKSLPRPAFEEHKEYMADTISLQAETEVAYGNVLLRSWSGLTSARSEN